MKNFILVSCAFLFLLSSCDDGLGVVDGMKKVVGKGNIEKENRDAKDFKGIDLACSGDVFIKQGSEYKVTIESQKNIIDLVETNVENGILKLTFKKGTWNVSTDKLNFYIETPSVSSLTLSGSGSITIESALTSDNLAVSISGSGNIKAATSLTAQKLNIEIGGSGEVELNQVTATETSASVTGSGDLNLKGKGEKAHFEITGSGGIDADEFVAKAVEANTTGSGDIHCHATESVDAQITGSGDVNYAGNPPSVKSKVTGSGSVEKK
ncbi:MAG: DUF2807 domain-containing protein [Saprospiraceae bacterium]|nr:DUF2807 domain-containing protein [Saprospiraceae bacterium]